MARQESDSNECDAVAANRHREAPRDEAPVRGPGDEHVCACWDAQAKSSATVGVEHGDLMPGRQSQYTDARPRRRVRAGV